VDSNSLRSSLYIHFVFCSAQQIAGVTQAVTQAVTLEALDDTGLLRSHNMLTVWLPGPSPLPPAHAVHQAVHVYETMTAAGVEPNGATYNAALTSFARSGQLDAALTLFAAMGARGYERGTNTYAAVLAACEGPGR